MSAQKVIRVVLLSRPRFIYLLLVLLLQRSRVIQTHFAFGLLSSKWKGLMPNLLFSSLLKSILMLNCFGIFFRQGNLSRVDSHRNLSSGGLFINQSFNFLRHFWNFGKHADNFFF